MGLWTRVPKISAAAAQAYVDRVAFISQATAADAVFILRHQGRSLLPTTEDDKITRLRRETFQRKCLRKLNVIGSQSSLKRDYC